MSIQIQETELPISLDIPAAVDVAYSQEAANAAGMLLRGLPVLIECDKELSPFLFANIRNRLKPQNIRCLYLDGRPRENDQENSTSAPAGMMGLMINQLREAVRASVEKRVVVLPHLDLLTTSQGGLTSDAREVIPLLYENPELTWLGFKDPSFSLPKVIDNLFPQRISILGTPRAKLKQLITQKESRKFGKTFNPWSLYKYVSGLNAVRLRRLLSTIDGEDYPNDPKQAIDHIRKSTVSSSLEIPNISLENDIGGYAKTKARLQKEILDVLTKRDQAEKPEQASQLEELIPRGMIFWGPPGTGKTYFAKAIASAIGAAITVVSGPELKSKWVGESEENLRQLFHKARQSAPSVIVFDELDSFATARGTYTGSGVEHSMVNQLLTEMDGFHKDELVFVIGTTNFVESLDPALLRPGRFEFHLHIPYPEAADRKAIFEIYNQKLKLNLTEKAIDYAVKRTGDYVIGAASGTRYSGDHLNALCRSLARIRLREGLSDETNSRHIDQALTEYIERPNMTSAEENVLATHEAGHAVVALFCENSPPVERVTIASEMRWAFGYVKYADHSHQYIKTVNYYLDLICVALAAREAERMLLNDISLGALGDLQAATGIARELVEQHGLGEGSSQVQYFDHELGKRQRDLSQETLNKIDLRVEKIIEMQRIKAEKIVHEQRALIETLRDMLIEHKTIERDMLEGMKSKSTGTKSTGDKSSSSNSHANNVAKTVDKPDDSAKASFEKSKPGKSRVAKEQ